MTTREIFSESISSWRRDPVISFDSWMKTCGFGSSTVEVYRSMWLKLLRHADIDGLSILDIDHRFMTGFLDETEQYREHRRRYSRLVERVFDHLGMIGHPGPNPGRVIAKKGLADGHNNQTRFLTPVEITLARKVLEGDALPDVSERDMAIAALQLGAGLKTSEVIMMKMTVNCTLNLHGDPIIVLPFSVGSRNAMRRPRILDFAKQPIVRWIELRQGLQGQGGDGSFLFPGEPFRSAWPSAACPAQPLHAASMFRAARKFLLECGMSGERLCGQTLRNTYALLLRLDGEKHDVLMQFLGINSERAMARLGAAIDAWIEAGIPSQT